MKPILLFTLVLLLGFNACIRKKLKDDKDYGTVCPEMFTYISVTVNGGVPDDYYTIRVSTGDTIRLDGFVYENSYPILDDNFQPILKGKQESFRFICIKNNAVVANELYVITAGECSISKVSGKDEVTI